MENRRGRLPRPLRFANNPGRATAAECGRHRARCAFTGCLHGRVLRTGGRVGLRVWAPPEEAVGFAIVLSSIQTHGNTKIALPEGPPFFRFSEAVECRRALERAGFAAPGVTRVPQLWRLPDPDSLFQAILNGTVRTGGLLR